MACWVLAATWAFPSCGEQGRGSSLAVVCRPLVVGASLAAEHRLQGKQASVAAAHLVVPRHVASSWTRGPPSVPSIGRQILNHWTTREIP